jgi:hypothetical protein
MQDSPGWLRALFIDELVSEPGRSEPVPVNDLDREVSSSLDLEMKGVVLESQPHPVGPEVDVEIPGDRGWCREELSTPLQNLTRTKRRGVGVHPDLVLGHLQGGHARRDEPLFGIKITFVWPE